MIYQCKCVYILQYLSQMGYCPQMNAMIKSLNAYEHLKVFARIRGIPNQYVNSEVNKWINKLGNYFNYHIIL